MTSLWPLLVCCLLSAVEPAPRDGPADGPFVVWRVDGGRVVLHIFPGALESAGLRLEGLAQTAEVSEAITEQMEGALLSFAIDEASDLRALRNPSGDFQPYGVLGGAIRCRGGFALWSPSTGRGVDLTDFEIHARAVRNDGPGGEPDPDDFFLTQAGAQAGPSGPDDPFRLCYAKVYFAKPGDYGSTPGYGHDQGELRVRGWDLIVTDSLALRLGRPELAGRVLGYGKVHAEVRIDDEPWELPPGQNIFTPYTGGAGEGADEPDDTPTELLGAAGIDMQLGGLSSLVTLGHEGSFPTGRTGMSLTTVSCNVGDTDIPWMPVMTPTHPGIGMALYRKSDGRFEQVGLSWIKHGFFAQSNSVCTPCQSPGNGQALRVGCSDTYGSANNGDRFWLGPRDEWNPHTAAWEPLASYFDGTPVDGVRDESGAGNGSVDHRLEAFDVDLAVGGATYFYEAFYQVAGDVELSNNIASRRVVFTNDGAGFQASTPSAASGNPLVLGPAIQRWGQKRTLAGLGPDDGRVILAVQVTPVAGGQWRYEYALFNWTLNRRVSSFSIPAAGALLSAPSFHDIDDRLVNDWLPALAGDSLIWSWPGVEVVGHKVAGPLAYGTLYNFGFTSDRAPQVRDAQLGIQDAGPGGDLLYVETLGPSGLALSADSAAPLAGGPVELRVRGGQGAALLAALSVGGVALQPVFLLTGAPLPFVSGDASLVVALPAGLAGLEITLVAADVGPSLQLIGLSNIATLAVR